MKEMPRNQEDNKKEKETKRKGMEGKEEGMKFAKGFIVNKTGWHDELNKTSFKKKKKNKKKQELAEEDDHRFCIGLRISRRQRDMEYKSSVEIKEFLARSYWHKVDFRWTSA